MIPWGHYILILNKVKGDVDKLPKEMPIWHKET